MEIYQLWGLEELDEAQKERVARIVERMLETRPAAIIAGQCADRGFLARLCDMAHAAGAKAYQWTPLFAEYDERFRYDPIRTATGGALPRLYGSEFNFRCPASAANVDRFLEMQDAAMQGCAFDGVFLDRVRYPSFSYGDMGQLSCFCDDCMAMYAAGGVDAEALRASLVAGNRETFRVTGLRQGRVLFADENAQRFFDLRAGAITRAVERVARHYAGRGMAVAADLFPPRMAYLVGQSVVDLLRLCSFVKPMIYRFTQAPAGLPYEIEAFDRATGRLAELDSFCGEDPLRGQIRAWEELAAALGKEIFWGVEAVDVPGIARMTPGRIAETRGVITAGGGRNFCMSWSVLVMPEENISAWLEMACR